MKNPFEIWKFEIARGSNLNAFLITIKFNIFASSTLEHK